jgi:hypothetical protein
MGERKRKSSKGDYVGEEVMYDRWLRRRMVFEERYFETEQEPAPHFAQAFVKTSCQ